MIIDDPTVDYVRSVEDVCIPMIIRFDRLMFVFRDMEGNIMRLNGEFELQLTIEDVYDQSAFINSTNEPVLHDRSVWQYHQEGSEAGQSSFIRSMLHLVCVVVYGLRVAQCAD